MITEIKMFKYKYFIFIFNATLISSFLFGCQQSVLLPTTGDYQPGIGWFDRAMIQMMEKWEIPGGALAVMQDGEIVLARGYGYEDVKKWDFSSARFSL